MIVSGLLFDMKICMGFCSIFHIGFWAKFRPDTASLELAVGKDGLKERVQAATSKPFR